MFIKILQNYIAQVKETIGIDSGIADDSGNILACSNEGKIKQISALIPPFIRSDEQTAAAEGISFQKVFNRNKLEFVIFVCSDEACGSKYLSLMSISITGMKLNYDEKYDKTNFVKNIMMNSLLPGDIPARAKELHITYSAYRVALLIKTEGAKETYVHEVIQGIFPNRSKDFIIILDKERTVLIKELKSNTDYREIEKTARMIADTLSTELMVKAFMGVGTVVEDIKDIGRSFKEAEVSLLIGRVFLEDKYIYSYHSLGLGRLIYQLPESSCKLFLGEFFKDDSFEFLDPETMLTIQKFFENNLNISETSRQLFVHRNTLVYRLDKMQKLTGLDLRKFDDAITFKIAMLVKRFLDSGEKFQL